MPCTYYDFSVGNEIIQLHKRLAAENAKRMEEIEDLNRRLKAEKEDLRSQMEKEKLEMVHRLEKENKDLREMMLGVNLCDKRQH